MRAPPMLPPSPKNKWRYGLTALACMPPAALTFEKSLALVDKGAVPTDKRNHDARTLADGWDITLWHRLPAGGPRAFASVAVWRYDRRGPAQFPGGGGLLLARVPPRGLGPPAGGNPPPGV